MVSVAALQLPPRADESHADRLEAIEKALRDVKADLIVLPELWPTGFFAFDRYLEEAEVMPGPTVDLLSRIAEDKRTWIAGGSILERSEAGVHNTAVLIGPDGHVAGQYRKIHLFGFESREAEILTPGTKPCVVRAPWGTLGVSLCYDLRFPELYRKLVSRGAEIMVVCAAWPAARRSTWELLLRARAVENQAFVVGCAAAGDDSGVVLGGGSMVVDPSGQILASGGDAPETIQAELDMEALRSLRSSFPVLDDRFGGEFND